jgi:hypothetical protein
MSCTYKICVKLFYMLIGNKLVVQNFEILSGKFNVVKIYTSKLYSYFFVNVAGLTILIEGK